MKLIALVAAALCLTACAANPVKTSADTAAQDVPEAIKAFEAICMATAPDFAKAGAAAARFGITDFTDEGFMKMGFNKDHSLGVQIKDKLECVVTTTSQRNGALTRTFLNTVARASGTPVAAKVPTRATVGGKTFIFHHDRDGGEAFVMLAASR